MACALSAGRILDCKNNSGGIKTVWFADYDSVTNITAANKLISDMTGTFYQYDLPKGTGSVSENYTQSGENGTTFYEQVLEITLHKLSTADQEELENLVKGRPSAVVLDQNDNYIYLGEVNGLDTTGGGGVTGTAMGDLSGYTLTMTGQETTSASFVDDFPNIAGVTIVTGT